MQNKIKLDAWKILIAIIIYFVLAGIVGAEDWPMFQHDLEHTGETSDVIENPKDLELKWKFKVGGWVESSPAVSGKYIYFGSHDSYFYCVDKYTGKEIWKFKVENWVSSSPAVSESYVYFTSINDYIYCLDKNTGELKWKFKTGDVSPFYQHSSPVISGDYVYVGSRENYSFYTNEHTGERYIADNPYIYCLDKNTGELVWKFKTEGGVFSSPAVSEEYVYVGPLDDYIYCLDKDTGELKWKFETGGWASSSPAVSENYVYIGSEDNYIYCLDKDTGELKWKFKTGGSVCSSPAVSGKYVYVGSRDSYLYCLDKNNGELKWKFKTGGPVCSSPAVSGNYVYLGQGNYLYCIDKNNGELKWKLEIGNNGKSSPAVSGNYIYVGSRDDYIYAFGTEGPKQLSAYIPYNFEYFVVVFILFSIFSILLYLVIRDRGGKRKFNWKLPLYGLIGFGIGFVIGVFIVDYIIDYMQLDIMPVLFGIGGAVGGAALGLALKDKKKILYLSFAGAIGFAVGGALTESVLYSAGDIWGALALAPLGAVGGAALGLALKDKKKILYLSFYGAISIVICSLVLFFYIIFLIGILVGFTIMGSALGLTLAYLTKEEENKNEINSGYKYCPECGEMIERNSKYCPNCEHEQ